MPKPIKELLACAIVGLSLGLVMAFILISWAEQSHQENIAIAKQAQAEQARLALEVGDMIHKPSPNHLSKEAIANHHERPAVQSGDYCHLAQRLLIANPQGLRKQVIQMTVGISAKTADRVLTLVAVERDGKYFVNSL